MTFPNKTLSFAIICANIIAIFLILLVALTSIPPSGERITLEEIKPTSQKMTLNEFYDLLHSISKLERLDNPDVIANILHSSYTVKHDTYDAASKSVYGYGLGGTRFVDCSDPKSLNSVNRISKIDRATYEFDNDPIHMSKEEFDIKTNNILRSDLTSPVLKFAPEQLMHRLSDEPLVKLKKKLILLWYSLTDETQYFIHRNIFNYQTAGDDVFKIARERHPPKLLYYIDKKTYCDGPHSIEPEIAVTIVFTGLSSFVCVDFNDFLRRSHLGHARYKTDAYGIGVFLGSCSTQHHDFFTGCENLVFIKQKESMGMNYAREQKEYYNCRITSTKPDQDCKKQRADYDSDIHGTCLY